MVPAQSISFPATSGAGVTIVAGQGILKGWAVRETTGLAVAAFNLWDGTANASLLIAPVNLATSESSREWFGELGISFTRGLFVEVTAGTVIGALWVIPQEVLTVDGAGFAYATAPAATQYPSLGIEGLE